ncbi:MAG: T9SS type A sorting domain-containing protein [Saprospiraceae bacterium]|nr:T9SS type A sorting domain-containing protein [Saprospiraceae bacterium]
MRQFLLLLVSFAFYLKAEAQTQTYYTVKFPNDFTVYGCGATADTIWPVITQYGYCNGFNVGVSVHDQVFYSTSTPGCYKIDRRFRLIWWCDYNPNTYNPYLILNPVNSDVGPTVNGDSWNHGYLEYHQIIKVQDVEVPIVIDCPASPVIFCDLTENNAQLWNAMYWWDGSSHDLCEGPADLSVTATDACSGNNVQIRYQLFLDLDGVGPMETVVSSNNPPPANTVNYNNLNTPNFSGGTARAFDQRNVPANQKYGFTMQETVSGNNRIASVRWNTQAAPGTYVVPEFPYGTHKIKWFISDGCGNEKTCEYTFVVKDCKPPTVVCHNGLSVNIMQTGMITLWDTDFLLYAFDNCTPSQQLKYGIRKSGTGTGFPLDSHSVTFDCTEIGTQPVEIWSVDAAGNAAYCETYVIVQDNSNACGPSGPVSGNITTAQLHPAPGVTVNALKSNNVVQSTLTDANGNYLFANGLPAGCNYLITPSLDGPAADGLTVLDALLNAAHNDGTLTLPTPLDVYAADADGDGQVTSADWQTVLDLVLGASSDLPGNVPTWKFIPAGYNIQNPAIPPGNIALCLGTGATAQPDFTAVKTGDLDGSAQPDGLAAPAEDRQKAALAFLVPDLNFEAGQEVRIDLITPDLDGIAAFQLSLDYNPAFLTLNYMEGGLLPLEMTAAFTGSHQVTAAWFATALLDPSVQGKDSRQTAFTLVFTALQAGQIHDVLNLVPAPTPAMLYSRQQEPLAAQLEFIPAEAGRQAPVLYPVQPNPAKDRISVSFDLPEAGTASLTLTDADGRVVSQQNNQYEAGRHSAQFELGNAPQGLMLLRLQTAGGTAVQRVMRVQH